MLRVNLQLFGGRGGSSGISGSFKSEGRGQWTLDTKNGGGVILDETGGSRDPQHGYGGKIYSAKAWDSNYNTIGDTVYYSSLDAAKNGIKDMIKKNKE